MSMTQLRSSSPEHQQKGEKTASILIVDDEKALRLVLRRAMEGEGYRAIDAHNGEQCLSICREQLPDLILLDAVMPGMDGFRCCSRLNAMFGDHCPPILIITALYDQASVDAAFTAGATDFIVKPIHWAVLRQRVKRSLKTQHLNAQWQDALEREQVLKQQLEAEMEKVKHLTKLCQVNGINTNFDNTH